MQRDRDVNSVVIKGVLMDDCEFIVVLYEFLRILYSNLLVFSMAINSVVLVPPTASNDNIIEEFEKHV